MTLQELIDRAVSMATRAVPPSAAPALAAEMVAEDLVDLVFQVISTRLASRPEHRSLLRRSKLVAFASGTAALDDDILTEYLSESVLYDTADTTTRYSWESQFPAFIRAADDRIGYYCCNEGTLHVVQPAATYNPLTGLTGSLTLVTPCSLVMPTSATTAIDCRVEVLDDLVLELANALTSTAQATKAL